MQVEGRDDRDVRPDDAANDLEQVATGFRWAEGPAYFYWRIALNHPAGGEIRFGASHFSQIQTALPLVCDEQRYPAEQRPPFSVAVPPNEGVTR